MAGFGSASLGERLLLYVPNRLLDLLDVLHLGYGVGPGLGVEFHFTRHGRLGAVAGGDVGLAWLGRWTSPVECAAYARASLGTRETIAESSLGERWRYPRWDVGYSVFALVGVAYAAIAPDEIVDFLVGFSTYDTKGDDLPLGPPPWDVGEPTPTRPRPR
ncbi:MAG: hypothetical protein L0323_24470 [Planctomycetes bacterium]|nr:hypothetical protein [Planctomycetota bacterium]